MMHNIALKISSALAVIILLTACDNYLDTNIDPNRTQTVTLEALLAPCIDATSNNHYLAAFTTGQFTQHLASYFPGGTDSYEETRMATTWVGIYLTALTNLDVLVDQAEEQSSPYYAGIGKILQAINLGIATDTWGDVPFSDAFQGENGLTPDYDSQEQIYQTINTLLDEAIADLQQPTSLFKPAADDLIFGGKLVNWIKVAYTLKARYAMHLTNRDQNAATSAALAALPLGISLATEDLQLTYNTVNRNPWYNNVSSPITTGNFTVGPSEQIISLMNGTYYDVIDPRLPKMFDNQGAATYSGLTNGLATGGNSRLSVNTWYAAQTAPLLMVTLIEARFLEAEARFLQNGGTTTSVGTTQEAYDAYIAGITAHFVKLGLDPAAYLANTDEVAVGKDNLTLELILKEKYIAMFLNPEAWVDVRRHQYNNTLYRGMELPGNYNSNLNNEFVRRVLYPFDEINRNSASVTPHIKTMEIKMWWEE
jgi:hypothetical protein